MKNCVLLITGIISIVIWLSACNSAKSNIVTEVHQVQVHKEGQGMIYIDKISCSSVMRSIDSSDGSSSFYCVRVGFIDSLSVAKAIDKKSLDAGKYFQYDMQKDWVAMVNGDSSMPVFYQPRQRIENHRHEGILVFEVPPDKEPDTLIYADSYSNWGTQMIIINSNKK